VPGSSVRWPASRRERCGLVDDVLARYTPRLNDYQTGAMRAITASGRGVDAVRALAGTGKTTMIGALATCYEDAGWRVLGRRRPAALPASCATSPGSGRARCTRCCARLTAAPRSSSARCWCSTRRGWRQPAAQLLSLERRGASHRGAVGSRRQLPQAVSMREQRGRQKDAAQSLSDSRSATHVGRARACLSSPGSGDRC
jgi:hypothetical protein